MSANTSQHNDSTSSSTAMNIEQLVPADEESIAALEFIGFTKATAHQIYQAWNTRPEQYPYSFLEHATGSLGNMHQGDTSDTEYMTKLGLKKEFQDVVLDLRFVSIFETESLILWIEDTLESKYQIMTNLQRRRRRRLASSGGDGDAQEEQK